MLLCCIKVGHRALKNQYLRAGYLAYGVSIIFLLQILVNAGMNMGMLPTKGLTLPLLVIWFITDYVRSDDQFDLKIDATTQSANPTKRRIQLLSGLFFHHAIPQTKRTFSLCG